MMKFLAHAALDVATLAAFVFVLLLVCGVVSARSGDCHRHATHIHCH